MSTKKEYTHSEEFRTSFGNRLRELRKTRGFNIQEAHEALGVPRSTYSGWELGKRIPLTKSLENLADLLETNIDYLMLKTDDSSSEINKSTKDLNEFLNIDEVKWQGKLLTPEQASAIRTVVETMLSTSK